MERELPTHVGHKLRLIATLFVDQTQAYNFMAERAIIDLWHDDTETVFFRTSPGKSLKHYAEMLTNLFRIRRLARHSLPLRWLRNELDDTPPNPWPPKRNPVPDTLDSIECRRFPGVNYRGYFGLWPIN